VTPPTALASKGFEVEEWADRRFFRPLGYAIARRLAATHVTADQVTIAALAVGLVAGHLFVYADARLNALGVALFVVSDVLDSADGQLARLRGTSTRTGRMLDGIADGLRFVNLYLHLVVRLLWAGGGWGAVALGATALLSHSLQAAAVDFVKNAYLTLGLGRAGELDLPETAPVPGPGLASRLRARVYADYVRRQAWLFPQTVALVRAVGDTAGATGLSEAWRRHQAPVVSRSAWIGQNIRFALLAVTVPFGWPAAYLWITVGPLNAILLWLLSTHERHAAALLAGGGEAPAHA
jgi:phosphatidylglycerophosphate synthase